MAPLALSFRPESVLQIGTTIQYYYEPPGKNIKTNPFIIFIPTKYVLKSTVKSVLKSTNHS